MLTRLYLGRADISHDLPLRIDEGAEFFLSLAACRGSGAARFMPWGGRFPRETCHHGAHNPLDGLRRVGQALVSAGGTSPLLMHANGHKHRLKRALSVGAVGTGAARWATAACNLSSELHRYPVLRVDSAVGGVCDVTSLGSLLGCQS